MRHHAFWALFSTYFFTAVGMFAISVQVVAYLIEAGFPPLQAATAWGFSGVLLVVGMLAISRLDGLLGRRPTILLSYGLSIGGIVMLWLLQVRIRTTGCWPASSSASAARSARADR